MFCLPPSSYPPKHIGMGGTGDETCFGARKAQAFQVEGVQWCKVGTSCFTSDLPAVRCIPHRWDDGKGGDCTFLCGLGTLWVAPAERVVWDPSEARSWHTRRDPFPPSCQRPGWRFASHGTAFRRALSYPGKTAFKGTPTIKLIRSVPFLYPVFSTRQGTAKARAKPVAIAKNDNNRDFCRAPFLARRFAVPLSFLLRICSHGRGAPQKKGERIENYPFR